MVTNLEKATNKIKESKHRLQELCCLKEEIETILDIQRQHIETVVERAKRMADEEGEKLAQKLEVNDKIRIERIEKEINRLQKQVQESEHKISGIRTTIDNDEPHSLVTMHNKQEEAVASLLASSPIDYAISNNPLVGMKKYIPAHKPFDFEGMLGSLSSIQDIHCQLVDEFGTFQSASYISTTSNDSIVVIDSLASNVSIYVKQKKYKRESNIVLSNCNTTNKPYGVAVTSKGKYVITRETQLEVYKPTGLYESALSIGKEDKDRLKTRCVTSVQIMPDDTVLVGDVGNSSLLIISGEGTILKEVNIDIDPFHICIISNTHVAVSNSRKGKVFVVDLETGKIVASFDIPLACAIGYHRPTDSFLIGRCTERTARGFARPGTGVLEQYCAVTGKLIRRVAGVLYNPQDVVFVSDGLLAVADVETVRIYKLNLTANLKYLLG